MLAAVGKMDGSGYHEAEWEAELLTGEMEVPSVGRCSWTRMEVGMSKWGLGCETGLRKRLG